MKTFGIMLAPALAWGAESRQVRVVVAATSQAKAVAAIQAAGVRNLTLGAFRTYGGQTWNDTEIEVTQARPGVVFWCEDQSGRRTAESYRPVVT